MNTEKESVECNEESCNIRQFVLAQNLMASCPNNFESKLFRCVRTYGKLLFSGDDETGMYELYTFPQQNFILMFDANAVAVVLVRGCPDTIGVHVEKRFKRLFKEHVRGDFMHSRNKIPKASNGDYLIYKDGAGVEVSFNYDTAEVAINYVV